VDQIELAVCEPQLGSVGYKEAHVGARGASPDGDLDLSRVDVDARDFEPEDAREADRHLAVAAADIEQPLTRLGVRDSDLLGGSRGDPAAVSGAVDELLLDATHLHLAALLRTICTTVGETVASGGGLPIGKLLIAVPCA
jgi:hypothetical protein